MNAAFGLVLLFAAHRAFSVEGPLRPIIIQAEKDFAAGKYDKAAQSFSRVIESARSDPNARTELGNALNDLGEIYREWHRLTDA